MDKKTTGIVAYLTWIGLLIAFLAGDREGAKFHLNQALVIWLAAVVSGIISLIPIIGTIISLVCNIFIFVCFILGLVSAIKDEEKEVPLLGKIKILK
jgi:uncharacterized membrane protein